MGSRSGIPIAGAWFSLLHLGYPHFKEQAGIIFKAIETVKNGIKNKIPELQVNKCMYAYLEKTIAKIFFSCFN